VDREGSSSHPHGAALGVGRDGFAALAQLGTLPETLTAQTPRGGRHLFFRHIVGGRSRKLCSDGSVEWFSTGKLVVVPPAPGRSWLNRAEIVEAPDWLRALVLAPRDHVHGNVHGVQRDFSGPLLTGAGSGSTGQVPREIYFLIMKGMRNAPAQAQRRVQALGEPRGQA
jgi:hypothetical protein